MPDSESELRKAANSPLPDPSKGFDWTEGDNVAKNDGDRIGAAKNEPEAEQETNLSKTPNGDQGSLQAKIDGAEIPSSSGSQWPPVENKFNPSSRSMDKPAAGAQVEGKSAEEPKPDEKAAEKANSKEKSARKIKRSQTFADSYFEGPSDSSWTSLREFYFEDVSDDPEKEEFHSLLAEAVLVYHAMSDDEREGDDARIRIDELMNSLDVTRNKISIEDVAKEWKRLNDHKKQILEMMHEHFNTPLFGQEKFPKVAYSTMKISGQHDFKEVCFVPAGMTVSPSTVSSEVLGKKAWRMGKPNMLVKVDCGARHPAALATDPLLHLPQFKKLTTGAEMSATKVLKNLKRSHVVSKESKESEESKQESDEKSKRLIKEQIDGHLKNSISREILPAVLDAAMKTNNWIFVDRSHATASSATAELLLETSLGMSTKQKPTVLVFDSVSRFKSFKPSRIVNMQLLEICQLLLNGKQLDDVRDVTDVHGLYHTSDFDDWEQYHIRNSDDDSQVAGSSANGGTQPEKAKAKAKHEEERKQREGNRCLPRNPEEAMVSVDENGKKCHCEDGRKLITPQVKWCYHYRQYLFSAGSHYVIFENANDSTFSMDSNGVPWREGAIFANGGNLSFERIQQALSTGTPTVMLYNTGGVAQTFASLHNWCVNRSATIEDECLQQKDSDPKLEILRRVEVVSSEPWTRKFGVSIISQFQNLVKRAPGTMRKSVVVVDILNEDTEQVVDKVTACFAGGDTGLPELGLGSAAEDVVLHAWKTHMTFTKYVHHFRSWADLCFYFSLVLTLISASVAILITKEDYTTSIQEELPFEVEVLSFLKRLLLVIPITTSVVAAITGKKRFLQKWATLKTAAAQIVAEIYMFRTGVLDYDPHWQSQKEGEDDEDDDKPEKADQNQGNVFNARELFVQRFREITQFALDSVGEATLKQPKTSRLDFRNSSQRKEFTNLLKDYVPKEVLACPKELFQDLLMEFAVDEAGEKADGVARQISRQKKMMRAQTSSFRGKTSQMFRSFTGSRRKSEPIHPKRSGDDDPEWGEAEEDQEPIAVGFGADNFVSPITIETYIEFRAKQLLRFLETQHPPLAKRLSRLETYVVLIGAVGTLLAAIDQPRWVALSVAVGTAIVNVEKHEMLQQRLHSTNSALRELNNNQILMDSLSIVSKRTQEMKGRCVNVVETAILETVAAWTGMTARPSANVNESKKAK